MIDINRSCITLWESKRWTYTCAHLHRTISLVFSVKKNSWIVIWSNNWRKTFVLKLQFEKKNTKEKRKMDIKTFEAQKGWKFVSRLSRQKTLNGTSVEIIQNTNIHDFNLGIYFIIIWFNGGTKVCSSVLRSRENDGWNQNI